ncbi:MAG TPA: GAF domain-containing sensor histidine kinase [Casimicrobiaceae bacterium]
MTAPSTGNQERFLTTLQKLLAIPAADLPTALSRATDALAEATSSDKVDAFLYDEARDSLVAVGTSTQPLSRLERRLGLDVLPLSNGGRVVHVYNTGETVRTGDLQSDPDELRGIKQGLGVKSQIGVPLDIAGKRRGMLMLASLRPDFYSDLDVAFVTSAAQWVGRIVEHSEIVQSIERNALEQGRSTRAEEILAVLAHDLRNYVSPVTLRLHKLRRRAQTEERPADVADADAALRGLARLNALISDLLDTARLDAGAFTITLQPIELGTFARDASAALSTAEHEIIVKAAEPVVVAADPTRLRQCLDNVLSNAIAHSPRNAPVNVTVTDAREGGRSWGIIEIVDEGPGIPDALLPRLFEQFFSSRTETGGVGLGLYIARRIALAQGGDIVADRYPGKGARFMIRIPTIGDDGT